MSTYWWERIGGKKSIESNIALLAKTCWRCLSNENLLSSIVLKAKYCVNKSLWDAEFRKGNYWFWKCFVEVTNFTCERVGWIIGNGNNIWVGDCDWIPYTQGLRKLLSRVSIPTLKVKDLWNNNMRWNVSKITNIFNNP